MAEIQFTILESTDKEEISDTIGRLTRDGWQLHGPLIVTPDHVEGGQTLTLRYTQALYKETGERRNVGFSTSR
ncbi:MAG TPA: hypothetical protein VHK69_17870 [Chitinophagaceae bacterium]|jgi:hypothetical protein|nr:hypothetical protein [Chitinophagaceae bacterium]